MRAIAVVLLALSGCASLVSSRQRLVRDLQLDAEEVRSADSGDLPYAPSKLPDLKPLLGMKRAELEEALGPGECGDTVCRYRYFGRHGGAQAPWLELGYDGEACRVARWSVGDPGVVP